MFIDVLLQGKSLEGYPTQIQNTKHTMHHNNEHDLHYIYCICHRY